MFKIILVSGAILFIALISGVIYLSNSFSSIGDLHAPSDSKLVAIFHQHRTEFEQLAKIFIEDSRKGLSVGPARSSENRTIKEPRWQAYLALLSQIGPGLQLGDRSEGRDFDMEIIFASAGCVICDDSSKGIDYIPGPVGNLGKVVPDLDHTKDLPAGHYLCPIEPNWYISYDFYKE